MGFTFYSRRGEQVSVCGFVIVVFEVSGFYPAFVDQGFEAVVGFAQSDAEFSGELALGYARVFRRASLIRLVVFDMLVLRLLCFSFKIADESLSERG